LPESGRGLHDGRVAEERELVTHRREHGVAILGGDELPLVQHHDRRASGGRDSFGQPLVLTGGPVRGVDHQDRDVRPVEGVQAAQHRVGFEPRLGAGALAHAGRVDEAYQPDARLDDRVDRVARRAGHVVHDGALLADELVEERGLADVGRPTMATRSAPSSSASATSSTIGFSSSPSTMTSSRSPVPRPCWALTG
jgi:hypothetical protein